MKMNKIVIIEIAGQGEYRKVLDYCNNNNISYDIYNYPDDITEWELDNELEHLIEYYCGAHIAQPLPAHIRYEVAAAAARDKLFNPLLD